MSDNRYKTEVLRIALFTGELMLKNGAETYRIEESVIRMCEARGFRHVSVFVAPTVIIVSDERFDGLSFMKTIYSRVVNLNKIDKLNSFSREFVNRPDLDLKTARKELKKIDEEIEYNDTTRRIITGTGSALFALMLGAPLVDSIFTFLVATAVVHIYDKIELKSNVPVFAVVVTSFLIAVAGLALSAMGLINNFNMLIVGAIMPLLPGVALVKSLRDLISGNLLAGMARMCEAAITATSIAIGIGFVLKIWARLGGVF